VVSKEFARVRQHAEAAGRDPDQLTLSLRVFLDPAGAMPAHQSISGSTQQMRDQVSELSAAGVQHVLLDPVARGGVPARLEAVSAFMEDVA